MRGRRKVARIGLVVLALLASACTSTDSQPPEGGPSSASAAPAPAGTIAISSSRDGPHEYLYTVDTDGSQLTEVTGGNTFGDILPAWSPDGTKLTFSRLLPSGGQDIFIVNADGTDVSNLTKTDTVYEDGSSWAPDGRTIAYGRFTEQQADIWLMSPDGSAQRRLTKGQPFDWLPSWSPDGSRIVFERHAQSPFTGDQGDADLFVVDVKNERVTRLTSGAHARNPSWSPDGSRIAFWADTSGNPIQILDVASGDIETLVEVDSVSPVGEECGVVPTWSPDGSTIAWAGCEHQPTDLYVMRSDGSGLTKVPGTAGASDPAWDPIA